MEAKEQARNNRLVLLTIIGIPVTMLLAATWLWFFVARGDLDLVDILGTANRGNLVQPPRSLVEVALQRPDGSALVQPDPDRHWTLLIPLRGPACDSVCESTLYTTRQIHLAMGREFNRIQRYLVSDTGMAETALAVTELSDRHPLPADFASYLGREHRGMKTLRVAAEDFDGLFSEYRDSASTWYLVDPAGWIMMSYDDTIHYKDVMADLKFLLKNSSE